MGQNAFVLMGGSDEVNGDYSWLKKMSRRSQIVADGWGCLKSTRKGDTLWFYVTAPISAIVAKGVALQDAAEGRNRAYETAVGKIQWIDPHVSKLELSSFFPDWGWANYTRGKTQLDEATAAALERYVQSSQRKSRQVEKIISSQGGGFGDPEKNRRIEKAAIQCVRKRYVEQGYDITSVEAEKVGYDLTASRDSDELHLEVKGVAGSLPNFIMTDNEKKRAKNDHQFRLVVVLNAATRRPQIIELTGEQLFQQYDFSPLAYRVFSRSI